LLLAAGAIARPQAGVIGDGRRNNMTPLNANSNGINVNGVRF